MKNFLRLIVVGLVVNTLGCSMFESNSTPKPPPYVEEFHNPPENYKTVDPIRPANGQYVVPKPKTSPGSMLGGGMPGAGPGSPGFQ
ncbi:MAG: hypothetical protein R3B84_23425 [Zavarzinella sp.]